MMASEAEARHQTIRELVEARHPGHRVTTIIEYVSTEYGVVTHPARTDPPTLALEHLVVRFMVTALPLAPGAPTVHTHLDLASDGILHVEDEAFVAGGQSL